MLGFILGLIVTILVGYAIVKDNFKGKVKLIFQPAEEGVRGATTEINSYVKDYALNIIEGAAKMHNLEYKTFLAGEANSLDSDEKLMDTIREVAEDLGLKPTPENRMPLGGSEDVSYMISRVQENGGLASFMRILTPINASGHNVSYNFDEQIIPKAISVFSGSAYKVMKGE